PHPRLHHPPLRQRLLGGVAPILTPPRGGVRQWPYGTTRSSGIPFQSSLRPEAECDVPASLRVEGDQDVSILTPPRGGVRRPDGNTNCFETMQVSILTPPRGGVRPKGAVLYLYASRTVSILTPPRGGVRPQLADVDMPAVDWFQSSLRPEAECDIR